MRARRVHTAIIGSPYTGWSSGTPRGRDREGGETCTTFSREARNSATSYGSTGGGWRRSSPPPPPGGGRFDLRRPPPPPPQANDTVDIGGCRPIAPTLLGSLCLSHFQCPHPGREAPAPRRLANRRMRLPAVGAIRDGSCRHCHPRADATEAWSCLGGRRWSPRGPFVCIIHKYYYAVMGPGGCKKERMKKKDGGEER